MTVCAPFQTGGSCGSLPAGQALRGMAADAWGSAVAAGPLAWWPTSNADFGQWLRDNAALFTELPPVDAAGYCNAADLALCRVANTDGSLRSLEVSVQRQLEQAGVAAVV